MSESKDREITATAAQLPTERVLHPMVEKVLALNPSVETVEKLMKMQEDWDRNVARRAFTEALVALKADLPAFIRRDQTVDFTGAKGRVLYTHTSLAAAMEAVQPALTAHGFAISFKPGNDPKGGVSVTCKLTHHAGHTEEATLTSAPDTSGSKSIAQGIASTITLLQRYTLLSILGIATADMEEPPGEAKGPAAADELANPNHALQVMQQLIKQGKTKPEIEKYVGRSIEDWTTGDIERLRAWWTETAKAAPAAPAAPTGISAGASSGGGAPEPSAPDPRQEPDGADLESKCPDCPFKTFDPEAYDGHLLGTGHGQPRIAGRAAKRVG